MLKSPSDLIIFMISSISWFEIINVMVPKKEAIGIMKLWNRPQNFLLNTYSTAAATVNPSGRRTILAERHSRFSADGKPTLIMVQ